MLEEKATNVTGYFPADTWYSYYDAGIVHKDERNGAWKTLNAPIDFINLHIRGGYIIPTQEPALTTEASRKNPFGIIVAPNEQSEAKGDLFYDNGFSELDSDMYYFATFILTEKVLKMNVEHNTYTEMQSKSLDNVRIFFPQPNKDLKFYVDKVRLSGDKISFNNNEIILSKLKLPMDKSWTIVWSLNDL